MRTGSGLRSMMVVAVGLIAVGAAALLYAPENKTGIKLAVLAAGVVIGVVAWLRSRSRR